MDNLIGKKIGNYEVIAPIGRGSFAMVYKVRDSKLNRDCALKVIQRDAFPRAVYEKIRKRFEQEAFAMANLNHEAIIKIFDYGTIDDEPYVIMELAEGGSLARRLGQPIPEKDSAALICQVAEGLDYAHRHGVIHRDVKPSNILIRKNGTPVLTDFGIGQILDERDVNGKTFAETSMDLGTVEYMAPEQSMGKETDSRADQYSLGVIFYEMLTGHLPFSGDTPMEVLVQQYSGVFPDPKEHHVSVSSGTMQVLKKSLSVQPGDRFNSMSEFSDALQGNTSVINPGKRGGSKPKPILSVILVLLAVLLAAAAGIFFLKPELAGKLLGWTPTPVPTSVITEFVPTDTAVIIPTNTDTPVPT
ncbi:MAG: serine/threonine protein kinase, partial [Anaerolineaceae bacterium]|nr:serine/threonine protein kinase [Anaerolineaceae bacterium]